MHHKLTPEQYFHLCFKELPEINQSNILKVIEKYNFDKNKFERLLIKTDLENFTDLLWQFGIYELYLMNYIEFEKDRFDENKILNVDLFKLRNSDFEYIIKYRPDLVTYDDDGRAEINLTSPNTYEEELELTELLLFLMEQEVNDISLNFKNIKYINSYNTKSEFITVTVINSLKNEFLRRKYNKVNMSYNDAENELINSADEYWIKEYITRFEGITKIDEYSFYFEVTDEVIYVDNISEWIDDQMINEYAEDHLIDADITVEFLKDKLQNLKSQNKNKVGAKAKNDNIAVISENISYLVRLEKFLKQDEYDDISKFPLSNKHCRLIHDYLVFFNLITDQNDKENNTTTPDAYIKALIKNYKTHRLINNRERAFTVINQFKIDKIFPAS